MCPFSETEWLGQSGYTNRPMKAKDSLLQICGSGQVEGRKDKKMSIRYE